MRQVYNMSASISEVNGPNKLSAEYGIYIIPSSLKLISKNLTALEQDFI